MITLHIGNRTSRISGVDSQSKAMTVIKRVTSYRVAGAKFSPAFKARRWDGKEQLFKHSAKFGYYVPTGLAVILLRELAAFGIPYAVEKETLVRHKRTQIPVESGDKVLRPYQREAIAAMLAPPFAGRGILKMPVRSGKTFTAANLISRIGRPTLFVVPSKQLLHQSYAELSEMLPSVGIGRLGDGYFELEFVTVATFQTLALMRGRRATPAKGDRPGKAGIPKHPRYVELTESFDTVIIDEVHRMKGQGDWYLACYDMDARFKMGLSATAFLDREEEQERGAIWMQAVCGGIKFEVGTSRLVEEGHLMRQHVMMHKVRRPNCYGDGWSQSMRAACISENAYRNRRIADLAREYSGKGFKVLIIARFTAHIAALHEECEAAGLLAVCVVGRTSMARRWQAADDLTDGTIHVVISNVLGEGVDIKAVDCVIVAEGGKDAKQTIQRQRNLTKAEGKTKAVLVDFLDMTNEKLEEHALARLEVYREEPSYVVRVFER